MPASDPAQSIADLKGYRILFGPEASAEKNTAAVAALRKAGIPVPKKLEIESSCAEAAIETIESKAKPGTAAVISSYAMALLEGGLQADPEGTQDATAPGGVQDHLALVRGAGRVAVVLHQEMMAMGQLGAGGGPLAPQVVQELGAGSGV